MLRRLRRDSNGSVWITWPQRKLGHSMTLIGTACSLSLGASSPTFPTSIARTTSMKSKATVGDQALARAYPYRIEQLSPPVCDSDYQALAQLLVDAVESGAAVSFLASLTLGRAEEWWRKVISASDSKAIFLVARDSEGIVGSVQLHPAWAPNQPHRGEIAKLLVHRRSRRAGLGAQLMRTIEERARCGGFTLLTLDAKRGGAAERLYRRLGWTLGGTIPRYALDPDGTPHDAVIFYKHLIS